jgi:hypothetical protein
VSGWHDADVDGVGTAVDDWGANDVDVVDGGADVDVVDGGADVVDEDADVDVADEGVGRDVETLALPHPTASEATSASAASFGCITVCEPNTRMVFG